MALNAKNLHYEMQEPEFLRKLRGAHSGDRQNVQFASPKKDRLNTVDEDDGPTIVDESGDVVEKKEYDAMLEGKVKASVAESTSGQSQDAVENDQVMRDSKIQEEPEKQKVAEIGGSRKRKAIKVVGGNVEDKHSVEAGDGGHGHGDANIEKPKIGKAKPSKKAKKVKLSFDEPSE